MKLKHISPKGAGYFCIVSRYDDAETGLPYAMKQLKKEHYANDEYRYRLKREIALLKDLQQCPNIVELIDNGNDPESKDLWYLMPFADHNLYDYIRRHNSTLTVEERFNLAQQVLNAIKFAHLKKILHRDISPQNVLVFLRGGTAHIKVADFGLGKNTASLSFHTKSSAGGYGQILYVSPEQREQLSDASVQSDLYSLGKLTYFIFTGRDPDNMRSFQLSSLVAKATEDNPSQRFNDIGEFESHFLALRKLALEAAIPLDYITLVDVVAGEKEIDVHRLHELLVRGNVVDHVYSDYISPVNKYLLRDDNLATYYHAVGSAIREFAKTYSDRLNECYQTTRWPFSEMETFGQLLRDIIRLVGDDETKLICLKQLWIIAFESDQWSVQKLIKSVFTEHYISKSIEIRLAEYIIESETEVDMSHFSNLRIPTTVKAAIIQSNIATKEKRRKSEEEQRSQIDW